MSTSEDYRDANERAQRVLAGEEAPPVEITVDLGAPFDAVTGTVYCAACGMDTLSLTRFLALPDALSPEFVASGLTCRICGAQQAITVEQSGGGVRLTTRRLRAENDEGRGLPHPS